MPNTSHVEAVYGRLSDEMHLALQILGIEFQGYRSEYWSYQFHDRKTGRNYHVDEEDMNDDTVKSIIDNVTARRRGATPPTPYWTDR